MKQKINSCKIADVLMKQLVLVLILALISISAGCHPAAAPVAVSNRPVVINDVRQPDAPTKPVAEMTWTGTDGNEQTIGELKDKVLILDFWATYCEPCKDEIPHLNSLQAKYGEDKLRVVGLNVGGDEDRPKIPAFVKQLKVSYPVAFPEDDLLAYVSGDDDRIPQTAVFDKNGNLVEKFVGFDPTVQSRLDRAVETAMSR
jgi:thiol-disulfide isomerase/thioredoxin